MSIVQFYWFGAHWATAFLLFLCMAGTIGAIAVAGSSIGTTDALAALFLCPKDVEHHQAKDNGDQSQYNIIRSVHVRPPLTPQGIFSLGALLRPKAQEGQHTCESKHKDQTAHKASTQAAGED